MVETLQVDSGHLKPLQEAFLQLPRKFVMQAKTIAGTGLAAVLFFAASKTRGSKP